MGAQVTELASVTLLTSPGLVLHTELMSFALNSGFGDPSRTRSGVALFSPRFDFPLDFPRPLADTGAAVELDVDVGRTDIFGRGWSREAISDRRWVISCKALSNVNFWSITKS